MTSKEPLVFIVDDDDASRLSINSLIQSTNLKTWMFSHPGEFLDTYEPAWSGCLISAIRMPGMGGLELKKTLLAQNIELPVIFVTAFGDIPTAVEAMKLGAFDFLEKPARPQYLLDRVQQAIGLDQKQREQKQLNTSILRRFRSLTEREREVMRCVVEGKANKVIAMELGLSQKTVEFHRAHVMAKMEADSIAELVRQDTILMQPRENPGLAQGISPFIVNSFSSMQ